MIAVNGALRTRSQGSDACRRAGKPYEYMHGRKAAQQNRRQHKLPYNPSKPNS
jgi:hypothetical protein